MPDPITTPITIPLSAYQLARFAQMDAEAQKIVDRRNEAVTTIIAADRDPQSVAGWRIEITPSAIVCTPPAEDPTA